MPRQSNKGGIHMSDRSRSVVLSIWVFVIPISIILLSVGTLDSGGGANAAPGAVSSTGTQQSGSTIAIGGPEMANEDGACFRLGPMQVACDCSGISCQCEDGACVNMRKYCNTKQELLTADDGWLYATRVKKYCFLVFLCKPEDEIEPRSSCGPNNPCVVADWKNPTDRSETFYYDYRLSVRCGGIPQAP